MFADNSVGGNDGRGAPEATTEPTAAEGSSSSGKTTLFPVSAKSSLREQAADEDGVRELSDVTELDAVSCPVDSGEPRGIGSIDRRMCQSNMSLSILSRYKVCESVSSIALVPSRYRTCG